jgi:ligand-binding sensor domain-containing protein
MTKFYNAFFILLIIPLALYPQYQNIKIERIMVEDGLPNGIIHDILQDHRGFIWFATEDGLCKYDGYTFTTYRHDPLDTTSIGSSFVSALYEDHSGVLWLATSGGGLNKFNYDY